MTGHPTGEHPMGDPPMPERANRRQSASLAHRLVRKAERVAGIVRKELLQIRRDPRLRAIVFVAPVIQLMVFGYAVSTDIRNTPTFLVDQDRTQASRELVEALTGPGTFHVVATSDDPSDVVRVLDRGEADLAVIIPPGFSDDLTRATGGGGGPARIQILVDGTNSNVARTALGYAERIVADRAIDILAREVRPGLHPPVALEERAWYNADLESRNYNVPAVVGSLMLLISLLLTSLAVVREREIGTLEQLMVSPLTAGELMVGKMAPFALIGLVDLTLVTTVALAWFRVPFRGSLPLLLLASLLFLLPALGLGLLISTVSSTQQEAFLTTFLVFMPTLLLSGFLFPVRSMPQVFRWITVINPLRHYLEIVRGVFLKEAGLQELWPQHLALLALGVVAMGGAALRFRVRRG